MPKFQLAKMAATALLTALLTSNAQADTIAALSFTGAAWADGGTLQGSFIYEYNTAEVITSIDSVDITTGPGLVGPGATYIYNVAGQADTTTPSVTNATASAGAYEFHVGIVSAGEGMYLDWTGVGASAAISAGGPGYYSSEEFSQYNDYRILEAAGLGQSSGANVPEPAGVAMMLVGLATTILLRRRPGGAGSRAKTIR
jgi:hypothetical protein